MSETGLILPAFQYTLRYPAMRDMDSDSREVAQEQRDRELEDFMARIADALGIGPAPTIVPDELDDLDDVEISGLEDGWVLTWDGQNGLWVAKAIPPPDIPEVILEPEVIATDLSDGAGIAYYGPKEPDGAIDGALWVVTRIDMADIPAPQQPVTAAPVVTVGPINA